MAKGRTGKPKPRPLEVGDAVMVRKELGPGELPCRCAGRHGRVTSVEGRPLIAVRLKGGTKGTWLEWCLIKEGKDRCPKTK